MKFNMMHWGSLALAVIAAGCGQQNASVPAPGQTATESASPAAAGADYLMASAPADAAGVEQVRNESENNSPVTVSGRIGGSAKPFVDGVAAFTIVDPGVHWCAAVVCCPTPWYYCCADTKGKMAMVKFVDSKGKPVMSDARKLLGVKELSKVIVQGTAQRDDEGNLVVLADKVHVEKE